jgi:hypothetical protein
MIAPGDQRQQIPHSPGTAAACRSAYNMDPKSPNNRTDKLAVAVMADQDVNAARTILGQLP